MHIDIAIWMLVLAALFGGLTQQLAANGGAGLLGFFGTAWRLPAKVVPGLCVLFGVLAGLFQNIVKGEDPQTAGAHAVLASIAAAVAAISTHAVGNTVDSIKKGGPPSGPPGLLSMFAFCFALAVTGCKHPVTPVQVADDIKVAIDGACQTITAMTADATVSLVCVTAEEIAQLGSLIVSQFGTPAYALGRAKCVTVQGKAICATPRTMVEAIMVLQGQRQFDGGAK